MFKKLMVALLAFVTMIGAFSNVAMPTVQAAKPQKRVVFSIDAGRKYFSKEQLIQIVEKAAANGYTDVQLILGNDGLRFHLDDMSLKVNGTTYASDDVKAALTAGNNVYYQDPNGDALTETEMNDILNRAKALNINIIPVINTPGHMDAILEGMEELGLTDVKFANPTNGKVSARTVNLNNDVAIEFCKEFVKKYVTYFASKGTTNIFNFGADEYANDVFPNRPGWAEIQNNGVYNKFVTYVNDLCQIIKDAGLQPMCFNDGIYYNSKDQYGTFDQDLIISFWTGGWWGFNVASPQYLSQKGHKILNTNDGWYWVLGRIASGGYNFNGALNGINTKDFNELPVSGGAKDIPQIGSMQCVWCDEPSQAHDISRIMELMEKFAQKHKENMREPMADYTKVDEAIAKVPADLTNYTEASVQALQTALDDVVRNLTASNQTRVNEMATAIETAISNLKLKTADYSKVDEAIKKAEALVKENYVDFSKVNDAIKAVVRDLDITKQTEVDAMAAAINTAIDGLKLKTADYSKVDEAIKKAEALNAKDFKDFSKVNDAIKAVVRDLDITKQTEVDAMATALNTAIDGLVKVETNAPATGDYTNMSAWLGLSMLAMLGATTTLRKRKEY